MKIGKKAGLCIAAAAAFLIICGGFSVAAAVKVNGFTKAEAAQTADFAVSIDDNTKIKALPFSAAPSVKYDGGGIKAVAESGGWIKVVYGSGEKIKTGYIASGAREQRLDVKASDIILSDAAITLESGGKTELKAVMLPAGANEKIKFTSSDEDTAAVDENGVITAKKPGTAVVTASCSQCSGSVTVTVIKSGKAPAFAKSSYRLDAGGELDLASELGGADGVSLSSSDESVISIDGTKARAKGAGAAIITARLNGGYAVCRVTVENANKNSTRPLDIINSYGDLCNYHPSVYYFENGFGGYKYWMAYTPYKNNDDFWENPHIAVSNDLKRWCEPKGFKNPLEPRPENYERGKVYNSDTELVYIPETKTLECWWRFYDRPGGRTVLRRCVTTDGVHWSAPEDMLCGVIYENDFLSPAILYENGTYKMWSIDQNNGYSLDYRESRDGKRWSAPRQIEIKYGDSRLVNWHLSVIHTVKGYEMVLSAFEKQTNDHTHMSLYYTCSQDNVNYPEARLLFSPSKTANGFDNMGLYRSCLLYAQGRYYLFYSALHKGQGASGIGMISGRNIFTMS